MRPFSSGGGWVRAKRPRVNRLCRSGWATKRWSQGLPSSPTPKSTGITWAKNKSESHPPQARRGPQTAPVQP